MITIKNRVRDLREDNDLKQRELAEYLYITQNTYSAYERGVYNISSRVWISLALLYGTSIDYLMGLTDDPTPTAPTYERIKIKEHPLYQKIHKK